MKKKVLKNTKVKSDSTVEVENNTTVIDRSTWGRGLTWKESKLYNPETGKFCCFGEYSRQKGVSLERLANKVDPGALLNDTCDITKCPEVANLFEAITGAYIHKKEVFDAMKINDAEIGEFVELDTEHNQTLRSEEHREQLITKLFDKIGEKIEFIN